MPTYKAAGVTATLSITDLKKTLPLSNTHKDGKHSQEEAKRIAKAFGEGLRLGERPIAGDGGETGVMQFIGDFADVPFFMVEAGEGVNSRAAAAAAASGATDEHDPHAATESEALFSPAFAQFASLREVDSPSVDSSLTSLGATPVFSTPQGSFTNGPTQGNDTMIQEDTIMADTLPEQFHTPPEVDKHLSPYVAPEVDTQALRLAVKTSTNTHKARLGSGVPSDLKIEVFLNGHLADINFINVKRQSPENLTELWGSRIHVSMEKPWIYDVLSRRTETGLSALDRWNATATLLQKEADNRGTKKGSRPPSGEFLEAMRAVKLPDRLENQKHLGLLDLVITSGRGSKKGYTQMFETRPARMHDKRYSKPIGVQLPSCAVTMETSDSSTVATSAEPTLGSNEPAIDQDEPIRETHESAMNADEPATGGDQMTIENNLPAPAAAAKDVKHTTHSSLANTAASSDDPFITTATPDEATSLKPFIAPKLPASTSDVQVADALSSKPQLSPADLPIAKRRRTRADSVASSVVTKAPRSQTQKAKADKAGKDREFAKELGIELGNGVDLDTWINRAHKNGSRRTVQQCLGHIKQMNRDRRAKAVQVLLGDIANLDELKQSTPVKSPREREQQTEVASTMTVTETAQVSSSLTPVEGPQESGIASGSDSVQDKPSVPKPPLKQVSVLAQARTDLVIDYGVPSNGYLVERIASLSPHKNPIKKQATPSADKPPGKSTASRPVRRRGTRRHSHVPVLADQKTGSSEGPQAGSEDVKGEAFEAPVTAPEQGGDQQEESWIPHAKTGEEANKAFKPPATCEGSILSFASSDATRQIGKTRAGEFQEDELVVGMRFIVV